MNSEELRAAIAEALRKGAYPRPAADPAMLEALAARGLPALSSTGQVSQVGDRLYTPAFDRYASPLKIIAQMHVDGQEAEAWAEEVRPWARILVDYATMERRRYYLPGYGVVTVWECIAYEVADGEASER